MKLSNKNYEKYDEEVESMLEEISALPEKVQVNLAIKLLGFTSMEDKPYSGFFEHNLIEDEIAGVFDFSASSVSGIVKVIFYSGRLRGLLSCEEKIEKLTTFIENL